MSKDPHKEDPNVREEHLRLIADHAITFFTETADSARNRLEADSNTRLPEGMAALANTNTLTNERASRNLAAINSEVASELLQIAKEPAIARLVLQDEDGNDQVYFISRKGTVPVRTGGALYASYRSPFGRFASLHVGADEDVQTPKGTRNYELRERATLNPRQQDEGWDSANTVLHTAGYQPVTVVSLRQLLSVASPEGDDYLQTIIDKDNAAGNVLAGIRRSVVTKMGLRDQPLLDQIQDNIFRMPLNTRLVVLGPPGTGKTTTLIKRLGQKLDLQYLDDNEQRIVVNTAAGSAQHSRSWMMFTPTELLKQYVKEAFALEDIAASEERIKTWDDFRRELARNRLGIWRSDVNNGPFVFRPSLNPFQAPLLTAQIEWFEDFEKAQNADFWSQLGFQAESLVQSTDETVSRLGKRLVGIVANNDSLPSKFLALTTSRGDLLELVDGLKAVTEDRIRRAIGQRFKTDAGLLTRLMTFVATLEDASEDFDDLDIDDDEDNKRLADREAAIDALIRAVRAQCRAAAAGRTLQKSSQYNRLMEFVGGNVLPMEEMKSVGENLQVQTAARRFLDPMRRYTAGIPRRYRRYRRERQTEGRWYNKDGFVSADISALETDAIILMMLRVSHVLLKDIRIAHDTDLGSHAILKTVQDLFRTQIVVDEATDFSPIQLACMKSLCDPAANSFFACGDFNQRITSWGTRSAGELKWVMSDVTFHAINVSYRHSTQLNELAFRIALLSDKAAKRTFLPEHVANDGVKPVLAKNLSEPVAMAQWLATRIGEIERVTGYVPSIAVLVNEEAEVVPLAEALDNALTERSIRAVACTRGQSVGQDNDVRVFDVQHIKGLEFEAVFFIGLDELAAKMPDLFDKYLYVGTTRAATFLGVTTHGPALPPAIVFLEELSQSSWVPKNT